MMDNDNNKFFKKGRKKMEEQRKIIQEIRELLDDGEEVLKQDLWGLDLEKLKLLRDELYERVMIDNIGIGGSYRGSGRRSRR